MLASLYAPQDNVEQVNKEKESVYRNVINTVYRKVLPIGLAGAFFFQTITGYIPRIEKAESRKQEARVVKIEYGPEEVYAGVLDKLNDLRAKVDINYKRRYITEQFNNLLRAMFAVIVQGDYLGYKNDAKGEGYLYGSFIHFPVEINGEKYEANAWLYIRGPPLEEGGLPRRKIMYDFKNLNFVEYNIFLQKPGDDNVKHRKRLIVVCVGDNRTYDDKNPPHNADVYGYHIWDRISVTALDKLALEYAVAKRIPEVIEEIKEFMNEKKGINICFNEFKYDENNDNY